MSESDCHIIKVRLVVETMELPFPFRMRGIVSGFESQRANFQLTAAWRVERGEGKR